MPASLVRTIGTNEGPVDESVLGFGSPTTAGNFLAWMAGVWGAETSGTEVPTGLGTWEPTAAANEDPNENCRPFISFNKNCNAGTTVTADYGTGYYWEGSLSEFTGVDNSAPLHQEATNSGSSTTPTSGTTPDITQADALALAQLVLNSGTSDAGIDVPSGYDNLYVNQDGGSTVAGSSDYDILSTTGPKSAGWGTLTGEYLFAAKIAIFKAAVVDTTRRGQVSWSEFEVPNAPVGSTRPEMLEGKLLQSTLLGGLVK